MSKRAERKALESYPTTKDIDWLFEYRKVFIQAYEQAEKDILSIIQSRLNEIQGDAQPRPILRAELQELMNKIMGEEK